MPVFESIARVGVAILVNGIWQGALIAFITWAALRLFSNANASTRYAVWALALLAVVIVPVATSLSRVAVESSVSHGDRAAESSARTRSVTAANGVAASSDARSPETKTRTRALSMISSSRAEATAGAQSGYHLVIPTLAAAAIFGLWALVAILVVARLAVALFALERLKRDALPLGMEYRDSMPRWKAALKGHRDVRLCVSDEIEVPIAVGLFDAMILLPAHLIASLEPSEIDQISLHELAHLLRSDDWTNGLQRFTLALLFFNPAVIFIARQLDIEREVACDDFVLEFIGSIKPYAFCLTKMAEMTAWPHRAMPAPGAFVTRKNISIRIERLLRTGRAIGSSIAPNVAATVVGTFVAIFFLLRTMTPSIAFTENVAAQPPAPASAPMSVVAMPAPRQEHPLRQMHSAPPPLVATVSSKVVALVSTSVSAELKQSIKAEVTGQTPSGRANQCVGCDFGRAELANKDFSNRSMEGSNFAHADLRGAKFDHATLTGVDFTGADLSNASFVGANMEGCNLRRARIEGARFDGASLTGCSIDPRGFSPTQARAVLAACEGCDFAYVNLRGMDLRNVHVEGANFENADLRDTNLSGAMFTGVNFARAQLSGARVDNTDFTGCNFSGADLRNVDLSRASLTGSSFESAIRI